MIKKALSTVVLSLAAAAAMAMPTTPASKDDAKALAERAMAHVKKVGFEQAMKDFTTDQATWGLASRDRVVYVYSYAFDGKNLAHGVNPAVVGKELLNIKDPDGRTPIAESVQKAKSGGGFVEFKWSHPATKKIARGAAFVIPVPGKDAYIAGHAFLE
jgi:signal transduction histidine kinase